MSCSVVRHNHTSFHLQEIEVIEGIQGLLQHTLEQAMEQIRWVESINNTGTLPTFSLYQLYTHNETIKTRIVCGSCRSADMHLWYIPVHYHISLVRSTVHV